MVLKRSVFSTRAHALPVPVGSNDLNYKRSRNSYIRVSQALVDSGASQEQTCGLKETFVHKNTFADVTWLLKSGDTSGATVS